MTHSSPVQRRSLARSRNLLLFGLGFTFLGLCAGLWIGPGLSSLIPTMDKGQGPLSGVAWASPIAPPDLPDLIARVLPGVVNISSTTVINYQVYGMDDFLRFWGIPQQRKQTALGSGFIIDRNGYVLTNNHVVDHASEVLVTLLNKKQYRAKIIGTDPKMDIALLQIRNNRHGIPKGLTPVPLANSDVARIGESVFAVGNPFGLANTVTLGIISAKDRTIGQGPFDDFLQTDASINPGNSGGPLFNLSGAVVGINTMIFSRTGQSGGLGFAIPINEAKKILPDLKRYGRVPRPWLGILGETMNRQLEVYYELHSSKGVLIDNLVQNGPADRAGIQQGDIIISVDGEPVLEPDDIARLLAKHRANDIVTVGILRGRIRHVLKVQLHEQPRKLDGLPKGII